MGSTSQEVYSWLNQKFNNSENGVFIDTNDFDSFDLIQDFLELKDHQYKTPAIYYQAFPDEHLPNFILTLEEELRGKLGYYRSNSCSTMSELISLAELKTVIIDRSYLYTWEMIDELWKWLAKYQVGVILISSQATTHGSPILNHPVISRWERFIADSNLVCTLVSNPN